MTKILSGKPVAAAMKERQQAAVAVLKGTGTVPSLAIIRVGEKEEDIAYERGAIRCCESVGITVRRFSVPFDAPQEELLALIEKMNKDNCIHGVLLLRPLPKHMDDTVICNALSPKKDIDGITNDSLAGVFAGTNNGFPPCTAQACMEILSYYGLDLRGKRVTVIGRSLVIGKPVAMMLIGKHATVTMCHTQTLNLADICRNSEVLIAAVGKAKIVGKDFFSYDQVILDVGINVDENGNLCGDVDCQTAESMVAAITPVPGGVGTVTTSVLAEHVIAAAQHASEEENNRQKQSHVCS